MSTESYSILAAQILVLRRNPGQRDGLERLELAQVPLCDTTKRWKLSKSAGAASRNNAPEASGLRIVVSSDGHDLTRFVKDTRGGDRIVVTRKRLSFGPAMFVVTSASNAACRKPLRSLNVKSVISLPWPSRMRRYSGIMGSRSFGAKQPSDANSTSRTMSLTGMAFKIDITRSSFSMIAFSRSESAGEATTETEARLSALKSGNN